MLLLSMTNALVSYFNPEGEDKDFFHLQEELRFQVSLKSSLSHAGVLSNPSIKEQFESSIDEGFRKILDDAKKASGSSEEAARIAIVTSRELGEQVPWNSLNSIEFSKDRKSRLIYALFSTNEVDPKFVEQLSRLETDEFAVRLALAQARESLGEDSHREDLLVDNLFMKMGALGLLSAVAFFGGIVVLFLFFKARAAGILRPKGFARFNRTDGDRYVTRFGFYLVAFLAMGLGAGIARALDVTGVWVGASALVATLALTVGFLYVPLAHRADSIEEVCGDLKPLGRLVAKGLVAYVAIVPLIAAALVFAEALSGYFPQPSHPIQDELRGATGAVWIGIFLMAAVLAPILEELTFRGLLFPALASNMKRPLWAILACGFLFACIHPQGPLIWPALMAVGAAAAYLRYYTGSIVPSVVLHATHNGLLVLISLVLT